MNDRLTTERRYQSGFGNEYGSEAVAGALPQGRNSPQRAPFDLYPEPISGTAFTAPRFIPTAWALQSPALDAEYADCWAGLKDQFKP